MFLHSKKLALFTVCALSLSIAAPIIGAGDEQKPAVATKITPEQNNKLNIAIKVIAGVVVLAVVAVAAIAVKKSGANLGSGSRPDANSGEGKRA